MVDAGFSFISITEVLASRIHSCRVKIMKVSSLLYSGY